jgi:hypothetical protein
MGETLERAFPVTDRNAGPASGGMTLRDYFAARALQGILSSPDGGPDDWQRVADAAYYAADAMLAARERKEESK